MIILAVDDEKLMLERLVRCIKQAEPQAQIHSFQKVTECLTYANEHPVDIAFLDIHMRAMDGMELARHLKKIQPNVNIIFCTGYDEYLYDAIAEIRCSGYIMKPVTVEQIRKEIDNLRYPVTQNVDLESKIFIQCFGNFEVFYDGKALRFEPQKAKELLAYLVDRNGAMCSNAEITSALWEDDADHYSYLKKCKKMLLSTFKEAGCEDIIISQWGSMGVNKEVFSCDYYEWLRGSASGINAYHGQYMAQYSWAEVTNAALDVQLERRETIEK